MPFLIREDYSVQSRGGGECSFCGAGLRPVDATDPNGPRERVIDTNIFIETEGIIEFCETCAVEIGTLVGMIEEPVATGLKIENAALRKSEKKAQQDLEKAREAFINALPAVQADAPAPAKAVAGRG